MRKVYIASSNVITSLGFTQEENAAFMEKGQTGIRCFEKSEFSPVACYASKVADDMLEAAAPFADKNFTRFEKLLAASVKKASENSQVSLSDDKTIFVFSTTKGNINQIADKTRLRITESVKYVSGSFGNKNKPVTISNACISGSAAVIYAARLLQAGRYTNAVVTGADVLSSFTVSGFQSFKALSPGACKPFDSNRDGVTLGEGAGTIILTTEKSLSQSGIFVAGGGTSNDANHISGPSRTGDGLYLAIMAAMKEAEPFISAENINYLSAHGTATPYNDEMECKAFNLAGVSGIQTNSLKGYIGHTLGAAGLIESAMGIYSMENGILFPSVGYGDHGVSMPVNILTESRKTEVNTFLKTSSGFGGCNAALLFSKS